MSIIHYIIHYVSMTLSGTSMSPFKVHLNWFKDLAGYRLEDDLGSYGAHIVGNGGQLVPFSPFDGNDTVFADFASVTSSSSLLHFVEKYGLLGEPAYDVEIDRGRTKHTTFGRDEDIDILICKKPCCFARFSNKAEKDGGGCHLLLAV